MQQDVEREALRVRITTCKGCHLGETCPTRNTWRGNFTPGVDVCFIGEAPGEDEAAAGLPFVGRSGQLLQAEWLPRLGLRDDQWVITNATRCWPRAKDSGKTRPPTAKEQDACKQHLLDFLRITQPRVIVALGSSASTALTRAGYAAPSNWLLGDGDFIKMKHPAFYLHGGTPWYLDVDKLGLAIRGRLQLQQGPNKGAYRRLSEWGD